MKINELKQLFSKNKEALLFIAMGMLGFYLFIRYAIGDAKVDFSEVPAGMSGKRAYFIKMLIYKLGGLPLLLAFYLICGLVFTTIGILGFKKK